ncbi:hypothetical protein [Herbaspirillum camelliae]|nr:hypothetical protein [Herbaspirillum camelliae]
MTHPFAEEKWVTATFYTAIPSSSRKGLRRFFSFLTARRAMLAGTFFVLH